MDSATSLEFVFFTIVEVEIYNLVNIDFYLHIVWFWHFFDNRFGM